jgi:tRNA threonylcarbamoyladenosine biosynthesis protein TsaB
VIMLIVAIDTSGRNGSVALCRGDADSLEVLGTTAVEGGTYSAQLVPCIASLLHHAGVTKFQIEGFVVVDGPGSFTGLRVGLSTAKAFCEAFEKPLATVSMLEALAITHGREGEMVTTVLDAGRGEVYLGEYRIARHDAQPQQESIGKLADFLAQLSSPRSRVITTLAKLEDATVVEALHADDIARIGLQKLLAGDIADPGSVEANYIRRSDAELFSLPK